MLQQMVVMLSSLLYQEDEYDLQSYGYQIKQMLLVSRLLRLILLILALMDRVTDTSRTTRNQLFGNLIDLNMLLNRIYLSTQ